MKQYRLVDLASLCALLCALLSACGGGGGGSNSPSVSGTTTPAALAVSFPDSPSTPQGLGFFATGTTCTGQSCVLQISADQPVPADGTADTVVTGGTAPYTYHWTSTSGNRATIDDATIATPTFSATVNWSDNFTDTWQVTVTDAAQNTVSATLGVNFNAPSQDNISAQFIDTPVRGSATSYSVPTTQIAGVTAYPTQVYVPADYATTTDKLPVFYITDGVTDPAAMPGDWEFTDVCRILESQNIRAIVVGMTGQNRNTDYLPPGATAYYSFVTTELIPFVEQRYRVDPTRRVISGHSFGGLFAGLAFTMQRPGQQYFTNFIALDGSFGINPADPNAMTTAEQGLFAAYGGKLPGFNMVLSSSTGGNGPVVPSYYQNLLAIGFSGLTLTNIPTYNTQHLLMFDEGFAASVKILFPPQ